MTATVSLLLGRDDPLLTKCYWPQAPCLWLHQCYHSFPGTACGYQPGGHFDGFAFVLALCAVICVQAAVIVLNDFYDDPGGTDRIKPERIAPFTGGLPVIRDGMLCFAQMRHRAIGCGASVCALAWNWCLMKLIQNCSGMRGFAA